MKTPRECDHERLYLGSGSFYVFCRDCGGAWVAVGPGNDREPDYSRSDGRHRRDGEDRVLK